MRPIAVSFVSLLVCLSPLLGQAPGVPIYENEGGAGPSREEAELRARALELREQGKLLGLPALREQLTRPRCKLALPPPASEPLRGPQLWRRARSAYVRVGHLYQCRHCSDWHLNLAGGYAIAGDGVVATCHHVVAPDEAEMKDAWLVCADDRGRVFPVLEVLAADARTDVAILRTGAVEAVPLPLRVAVEPGEAAFVFSDPMGSRGYFAKGLVSRFVRQLPPEPEHVTLEVTADWAPGSSGSAVLDEFGNAIGHVASISAHLEESEERPPTERGGHEVSLFPTATYMVLRSATRAFDVLQRIEV
ncbi:MAG: trypsin-like peptidase domain-containing protein, partial [Planctomycetes bacterium]|nr:trypsin-like peptidase domain-containing protein [Planctomycetota bacterium]